MDARVDIGTLDHFGELSDDIGKTRRIWFQQHAGKPHPKSDRRLGILLRKLEGYQAAVRHGDSEVAKGTAAPGIPDSLNHALLHVKAIDHSSI